MRAFGVVVSAPGSERGTCMMQGREQRLAYLRLDGPNPPPVQPRKQRLELRMVHQHQPVLHSWPGEGMLFQPLVGHHQPGAVQVEQLQAICFPGTKDKNRKRSQVPTFCLNV